MRTIEAVNPHAPHPRPGQRSGREGDTAFAEIWADVDRQKPDPAISDGRVRMRPAEPEERVRHPHERRLDRAGEDGEGDDPAHSAAQLTGLPTSDVSQAPSPQAPASALFATAEPILDPRPAREDFDAGEGLRRVHRTATGPALSSDPLRQDPPAGNVDAALPADILLRTRVLRSETHLGPAGRLLLPAAAEPATGGSDLPAGAPRAAKEQSASPPLAPPADAPAPALASAAAPRRADSSAPGRLTQGMRPETRAATASRGETDLTAHDDPLSASEPRPTAARGASDVSSPVKPEPTGQPVPETASSAEEPQRLPADQANRLVQAIGEALPRPVAPQPLSQSGVFVPTAQATESPAAPQSPVRRLQLQLQPASLGTVEIELRSGPRGLAVTITAERSETARMLEADADLVADLVRSSGHDLEGLNVKVMQAERAAASPDGQPASGSRSGFGASAGSGDTGGGNQRSGGWEHNGRPARHGGGFEESGDGKDMRGGPDRRGLFV